MGILKALPAEDCIATSLSGAEPFWATIIPFAPNPQALLIIAPKFLTSVIPSRIKKTCFLM